MNKIVNKLLLAGDKILPELHLRLPRFTNSACGLCSQHCKRIQKFRKTGDLKHVCKNELDNTCFVQDTAYFVSKGLTKGTISDMILKDLIMKLL